MATKQDFELVAKTLRDMNARFANTEHHKASAMVASQLAQDFADVFEEMNPRFDRVRFIKAVTGL